MVLEFIPVALAASDIELKPFIFIELRQARLGSSSNASFIVHP